MSSVGLEERDSLTTEFVTNSRSSYNLGVPKTTLQSASSKKFSDRKRRNKYSRILILEQLMMTKTITGHLKDRKK